MAADVAKATRGQAVDTLFLDTTYCLPRYIFPSQVCTTALPCHHCHIVMHVADGACAWVNTCPAPPPLPGPLLCPAQVLYCPSTALPPQEEVLRALAQRCGEALAQEPATLVVVAGERIQGPGKGGGGPCRQQPLG